MRPNLRCAPVVRRHRENSSREQTLAVAAQLHEASPRKLEGPARAPSPREQEPTSRELDVARRFRCPDEQLAALEDIVWKPIPDLLQEQRNDQRNRHCKRDNKQRKFGHSGHIGWRSTPLYLPVRRYHWVDIPLRAP
jgi:hypothetical protein